MKKVLSIVLVLCLLLSLCAHPSFAEVGVPMTQMQTKDIITITLDGKAIDCSLYGQLPVIVDGRTLVPLRSVFEALGATVEWNNDERSAVSVKDGVKVILKVDSTTMTVNDTVKTLDVPACIMNERTMVPVRAIAEAFGCKVDWDNNTRTVIILTKPVEESPEDIEKKAEAEKAVISLWDAMRKNDYSEASKYCNINVVEYIDAQLKDMMSELEDEGLSDELTAEMEEMYKNLINTAFAVSEVRIEGSVLTDENTVTINVINVVPDFDSINAEDYITQEVAMDIMAKNMAEFGYNETTLGAATEEESNYIIMSYMVDVLNYTIDKIAADIDSIPKIEDNVEYVVEYIEGNWIVVEGFE